MRINFAESLTRLKQLKLMLNDEYVKTLETAFRRTGLRFRQGKGSFCEGSVLNVHDLRKNKFDEV